MRNASDIDLTSLPAHVLSAEVSSRRLSPVDLIEAAIVRIQATEPRLHAFVETYFDDARLAAEGADKAIRSGHAVGPLHGLPIALKDLVELEGRVATGGSKAWRERRAARTGTLAMRLIRAGLIVIGKTHTVEFALGGWGTNQHMGTPWNPWDLGTHRVPGGSSSGSGVAVAARMVPWAIGTDTGGSVRLPASFCGITGLKTTIYPDSVRIRPRPLAKWVRVGLYRPHDPTWVPGQRIAARPDRTGSGRVGGASSGATRERAGAAGPGHELRGDCGGAVAG